MSAPLRTPGGPRMALAKLGAVARLHALAQLAYPAELVLGMIFSVVVLFTVASMWRVLGEHHDLAAMTGYDLPHLVWYTAFTEALALSYGVPWEGLPVDREIRTGDVAYRLARPHSYVLYQVAACLSERYARLALRLPVHALIAWALVGWPGLAWQAVAVALVAGLLAGVADLAWCLVWSFSSFWVEDSFGLHFLYRRSVFLLGGLLIPLSAYPDWLRRIAEALPFKAILFGPSKLFVQADTTGALELFRLQLLMALSGFVVVAIIYRLGARRLQAQGG
ncbi:MAG: ABC-2 family transporter protein [Archangiaceae bacterium]|nr:ABC-2 family transporter protein [Archangiaceae bacterium]